MEFIDISKFEINNILCNTVDVCLILKGFNQDKITNKIIQRNGNRSFGLSYLDNPVERKYSSGLVFKLKLNQDSIDYKDIEKSKSKLTCIEPFDISLTNNLIAIASGNSILLTDDNLNVLKNISNSWTSFLHSVQFNNDQDKILITSAGFDLVQEIDIQSGETIWEWNSWDAGFSRSHLDNKIITRDINKLEYLHTIFNDADIIAIRDIEKYPKEGIPTQISPTRINGAYYDNENILISFYHREELLSINKDYQFTFINLFLLHPHFFKPFTFENKKHYFVTDSGRGRVLMLDQFFNVISVYNFATIESNIDIKVKFGEWLQTSNATVINSEIHFFVSDALRSGIHIINISTKQRRFIKIPNNWTLQAVVNI